MIAYPVDLIPDDDTIMVICPDVPELTTYGADADAALFHARDALQLAVSMRIRRREEIPEPSPAQGRPTVALSLQGEMKVMIYRALRADGLTPTELARKLGKSETTARRLLDLDHASPIGQIEQALAALGRHVTVIVEKDAA